MRMKTRIEKLKMSLSAKIRRSFPLGIENAVLLILFIKIFRGDSSDQSGQYCERNQVWESHEGVGHISYVPDDVQMDPLDDRTDKKQGDECNPEGKNDFYSEYILQTFLTEKKRAHGYDVPPEWYD